MGAVAAATVVAFGVVASAGQRPDPAGSFTSAQASAGRTAYDRSCAECHLADLGGSRGPALAGPAFLSGWGDRSVQDLFAVIKGTMPPGAEGSLSDAQYAAIVAYILQVNGHAAGTEPVQPTSTLALRFDPASSRAAATTSPVAPEGARGGLPNASAPAASAVPEQSVAGSPSAAAPRSVDEPNLTGPVAFTTPREVPNFTPVTDAMLHNPPPHEWLSWRRTLDGQGHSPLAQITVNNVHHLRAAWVWAMTEGGVQTTPLVHDGIMYLANTGGILQALDAKSGDLIWEYRPTSARRGGHVRAIAIYGDKIIVTTSDAAVVAVSARTGKLAWRTEKADPKVGFSQSAGPIIANGVVITGVTGCTRFRKEGCFITGHDADTGKELWRTSTIALPGDPNNASWGKLPPAIRGGTETWIPGSFDPRLNLFYIGTAQAKPWVAASRGLTTFDAALYSNSTLAIDPKSGKIVWYFQHVPGESLDLDSVFERILVDVGDQKVLLTVSKDGLMWKLNRENGRFLGVKETIFQNVFESIDRQTGKVRYRSDIAEAQIGDWIAECPGYYGGHNWTAAAYSPATAALVVPLNQHCQEMRGRKVELVEGSGGNAGDVRFFEMPGTNGNFGRLSAFSVATMDQLWTHEQRASFSTSVLTTAGGLSFVGDVHRYFKAFDTKTGKQVWQFRLGTSALGYPISYAVDGKQYIAVPAGVGPFPNIRRLLSPDIYAPSYGDALYVFELPEASGAISSSMSSSGRR
jgi:alcohol dehydrogenase (cytochrome c)